LDVNILFVDMPDPLAKRQALPACVATMLQILTRAGVVHSLHVRSGGAEMTGGGIGCAILSGQ
jgi:hypothetical protein